ncbi:helix-turn-helix domain-containing protein [Mycobacterium sp. AZCC_0083]|uniref:helix-turn-helix domain-containing protein n=1 Tax=Mycobacterium sp. AZCC_0083 TaxID=2735882 RepID=UPI0016136AC5|nr:helix-turn-helix domain-containing protein [Mycobacterium sp. AZCC_0083]MBB5168084.1 hypothetical protein [Mycobacterium sp. AZCC_0083]
MSSTSPAVSRALDVLLYLVSRSVPAPGAAIARDLNMPRSSTYHLLDVLIARGFVVHFANNRTGALGLAGHTWCDRPAVDQGDNRYLIGDAVAAPGLLAA